MNRASGRRENYRRNLSLAKTLWSGQIHQHQKSALKSFSEKYQLSVGSGDLQLLEGRWYVTHTGLIRLAERKRCAGINVNPMTEFCNDASSRWVFKAIVYKRSKSRGFVGYGDADPSNVSTPCPWRRDAHRRNAGGQPRPAKGVRDRPLLGRGTRVAIQQSCSYVGSYLFNESLQQRFQIMASLVYGINSVC